MAMRWRSVFLLTVLMIAVLPFQAEAVDLWGCCVPPFGACFDGSAFGDQTTFQDACDQAGDTENDAILRGEGSAATCTSFGECRMGCCCAGPEIFDSPTINNNENLLLLTGAACDLKSDYTFRTLPAGSTCVAVCGGTSEPPPPDPTDTYIVSGTVVNASDSEPLEGVEVFLPVADGDITDTTDEDGEYTLSGVPRINTHVFAIHDACQPGQSESLLVDRDWEDIEIQLSCVVEGCPHETPTFVEPPMVVPGTDGVEFTVSLTDICQDFFQFEPYRCDEQFDNCIALPPSDSSVILDEELQPLTTYCYNIRARFADGVFTETGETSGSCITTGDAECMENVGDIAWCGTYGDPPLSAILSCDEATNVLDPQQCTETDTVCTDRSGTPECVLIPPCDTCNGLLGLFAQLFTSLEIPDGLFTTTCGSSCNLDSDLSGNPLMVDAYASCLTISDCSEYKSEAACSEDTCGMTGCGWTAINEELGHGICTSAEHPPCDRCDDLFGYCNKDMCEAISSSCYFDAEQNGLADVRGCMAKEQMACRFYDTQSDCVGGGANAVYHIQYTGEDRSGGTNARTIDSSDKMGIGACTWAVDRCIKDADMKNNGEDDCIENGKFYTDQDCVIDSTPPETEFFLADPPVYSRVAVRTLPHRVIDDLSPVGEISTYICFGEGCYPTSTISAAGLPDEGEHVLRYFSIDGGENSEVIKETSILVRDTGEPAIESIVLEENT